MIRDRANSEKPRLLVLTSSFPRGPQDETCGYIRDFARRLSSGYAVVVLAPPDPEAQPWPKDRFVLVRSLSFLGSKEPFQGSRDLNEVLGRGCVTIIALMLSVLAFSIEAFRLARETDIICSHWLAPSGAIAAVIARLLRKPHVLIEHSGALSLLSRGRIGRRLIKLVLSSTSAVIVVSRALRDRLASLCPESVHKIRIIPMGVSSAGGAEPVGLNAEQPSTPIRRIAVSTLLFLGRLVEVKGVGVLLKAAKGINNCRVVIAGVGPKQTEMEALAHELGVDATFVGSVDARERERLLALADIVVIPSIILPDGRTEGMPAVCLEALAAGRPVVASRVGGIPEIIKDGRNGLLFDPGDHMMLRDRLSLLLSRPALRICLGLNAKATAAWFDWARVGEEFSEIIRGCLENGQNNYAGKIWARVSGG